MCILQTVNKPVSNFQNIFIILIEIETAYQDDVHLQSLKIGWEKRISVDVKFTRRSNWQQSYMIQRKYFIARWIFLWCFVRSIAGLISTTNQPHWILNFCIISKLAQVYSSGRLRLQLVTTKDASPNDIL